MIKNNNKIYKTGEKAAKLDPSGMSVVCRQRRGCVVYESCVQLRSLTLIRHITRMMQFQLLFVCLVFKQKCWSSGGQKVQNNQVQLRVLMAKQHFFLKFKVQILFHLINNVTHRHQTFGNVKYIYVKIFISAALIRFSRMFKNLSPQNIFLKLLNIKIRK